MHNVLGGGGGTKGKDPMNRHNDIDGATLKLQSYTEWFIKCRPLDFLKKVHWGTKYGLFVLATGNTYCDYSIILKKLLIIDHLRQNMLKCVWCVFAEK